jgi:hypothetical protein
LIGIQGANRKIIGCDLGLDRQSHRLDIGRYGLRLSLRRLDGTPYPAPEIELIT